MRDIETDSYHGPDRRGHAGWHVEKTISLSHIITTVTMIVGGIWYLSGQDQRISANEINIRHVEQTSIERDRVIERTQRDAEKRLSTRLEGMDAKLDKIHDILRER